MQRKPPSGHGITSLTILTPIAQESSRRRCAHSAKAMRELFRHCRTRQRHSKQGFRVSALPLCQSRCCASLFTGCRRRCGGWQSLIVLSNPATDYATNNRPNNHQYQETDDRKASFCAPKWVNRRRYFQPRRCSGECLPWVAILQMGVIMRSRLGPSRLTHNADGSKRLAKDPMANGTHFRDFRLHS